MSALRLPEPLKRLARAARDTPALNNVVTDVARPFVRRLPERYRSSLQAHIPRVGMASAELPNGTTIRLQSDEPEIITSDLFYSGWAGYEPEVLPLWLKYAAQSEVIVDVGAHIGYLSIAAALANPDARIYAFEPLDRVARVLRNNIALNQVSIEVRQRALGRSSGQSSFYAIAHHGVPSSSSLSKAFMVSGGEELERIEVAVSTLDEEQIPSGRTLLKMDTETTEPDVIAGAHKFLGRKPVIFVEVISTAERLSAELRAANYEYDAFLLTDEGPIPRPAIEENTRWRNWLLLPA